MRYLAIDPGDVRIGIAISDPGGRIVQPYGIIGHRSRQIDAEKIAQIAHENQIERIIVGNALDAENQPTLQSRKAKRLAAAIRDASSIDVELWDESGSSQMAADALRALPAKKRQARQLDDLAASFILQSYIEAMEISS